MPVYVDWMVRDFTAAGPDASHTLSFFEVELNTTSSLDVGTAFVSQLAASDQLFVEPPPSHVTVAADNAEA